MATLADIRTKVRRLTRSPSEAQLSNNDIDTYVDDFLLYDFPAHLRLNAFRRTLTFYTNPNVDVYETSAVAGDVLYDFKNLYITQHDPVYIAGHKAYFTQSRSDFYNLYPQIQGKVQIGTGDAATTNFTGTLSGYPVLAYNVLFSSIDANNDGLSIFDQHGNGALSGDVGAASTIDYATGVYDITFTNPPDTGKEVYAQTVQYTAARPTAVLYYDTKFTLRPVPDIPYQVTLETYVRPSSLENDPAEHPFLDQYWQWIAYGAAKKIFEDRMDMDSVHMIMPEFKEQETLCLRRTIVQQSDQRVATIYTQSLSSDWDWGRNNF